MSRQRGFTLLELLVVIGIIGVLTAILVPATGAVRRQAHKCICASNLRQIGNAILLYTYDYRERLPYVVEPMWKPGHAADLSIDPRNSPLSFINVMRPYGVSEELLTCPAYVLKIPTEGEPIQTYRVASANNADGVPRTIDQLFLPGGAVDYKFSLKYLNGRRYAVEHAMPVATPDGDIVGQLRRGAGPFYLVRDFVRKNTTGFTSVYTAPHNKQFNQLKLDMTVSLEKDPSPVSASP